MSETARNHSQENLRFLTIEEVTRIIAAELLVIEQLPRPKNFDATLEMIKTSQKEGSGKQWENVLDHVKTLEAGYKKETVRPFFSKGWSRVHYRLLLHKTGEY